MVDLLRDNSGKLSKFLIAFLLVMLFEVKSSNGRVDKEYCDKSLTVLKNTVSEGETFFIKVHAAENLIFHVHTEGLDTTFARLQTVSPDNYIGSARVLARLYKHQPEKYQHYINQLLYEFKQSTNRRASLTALESLGKLEYKNLLPELEAYADTGTMGFKGMARWVLSNNNSKATENRLSALLLSGDILDYRYAAYALRFKDKINKLSLTRLRDCLKRLAARDIARVYVASSLFVHSRDRQKQKAKAILLTYLNGDVGQRYEVAEALGRAGNQSDIPTLGRLFVDENADVRVAAANALLRVMHCKR